MTFSLATVLPALLFYRGLLSVPALLRAAANPAGVVPDGPVTVNILLTARCNLSCRMCHAKNTVTEAELPAAAWSDFFRSISRLRPLVHFGGGEPFCRADILDVIAAAKHYRLPCLISTNAQLLDDHRCREVGRIGAEAIILSIYGEQSEHDAITNSPGAWQTMQATVRRLLAQRQRPRLYASAVMVPGHINSLASGIRQLLTQGITAVKIEHLNYLTPEEARACPQTGNEWNLRPETLIAATPSTADVAAIAAAAASLKRAFGHRLFIKPALRYQDILRWYDRGLPLRRPCHFLNHSVFINANGDIIPCQFLPHLILGNIRRDDISTIWQNKKTQEIRGVIAAANLPVCRRCCKR